MSREIKFRAWDEERKEMFYPTQLIPVSYKRNQSTCLTCQRYTGDGFSTLMQYTGLKDKNGKEIYEGDIIEYPQRQVRDDNVIRWHGSGFWMEHADDGSKFLPSSMEVIGNIYENPELLQK
jgi:uncharacterized phage protein (TIGR01671 family)